MSLMTVEPGVKPGFFVARFLLSQLTNLTHSPRAGSYGESGGDLEFIPDSRSSLIRSQGQAPELSWFSRFSFPRKPPPGTGSVSWPAVGWSGLPAPARVLPAGPFYNPGNPAGAARERE